MLTTGKSSNIVTNNSVTKNSFEGYININTITRTGICLKSVDLNRVSSESNWAIRRRVSSTFDGRETNRVVGWTKISMGFSRCTFSDTGGTVTDEIVFVIDYTLYTNLCSGVYIDSGRPRIILTCFPPWENLVFTCYLRCRRCASRR